MQQLVMNALIAASIYALTGIGFALIYRATLFFHFAHASVIALSAYLTYFCTARLHLPISVAALIALAGGTMLGCAIDIAVYRPLRHRQASPSVLLLASLGAFIVIQNILSIAFGDDFKSVPMGWVSEGYLVMGARITPVQFISSGVALLSVFCVGLFLTNSRAGKELRAVANDQMLATVSGVSVDRTIFLAFVVGSALGSCAGILLAVDIGITPNLGLNSLLMGVVAVIVGGTKRITGVLLGCLLVAGAQQLAAWNLGSEWQDCAAFALLVSFLVIHQSEGLRTR